MKIKLMSLYFSLHDEVVGKNKERTRRRHLLGIGDNLTLVICNPLRYYLLSQIREMTMGINLFKSTPRAYDRAKDLILVSKLSSTLIP